MLKKYLKVENWKKGLYEQLIKINKEVIGTYVNII